MKKRWMVVIGSGVLAVGKAVAGARFANSNEVEVRGGTIRIEKRSGADFLAFDLGRAWPSPPWR